MDARRDGFWKVEEGHHDVRVFVPELDRERVFAVRPARTAVGPFVCRRPPGVDEVAVEESDVSDELLELSGVLVEGTGSDEGGHENLDGSGSRRR